MNMNLCGGSNSITSRLMGHYQQQRRQKHQHPHHHPNRHQTHACAHLQHKNKSKAPAACSAAAKKAREMRGSGLSNDMATCDMLLLAAAAASAAWEDGNHLFARLMIPPYTYLLSRQQSRHFHALQHDSYMMMRGWLTPPSAHLNERSRVQNTGDMSLCQWPKSS